MRKVTAKKLYHGPAGRPAIKLVINNCCGCGEVWLTDDQARDLANDLLIEIETRKM